MTKPTDGDAERALHELNENCSGVSYLNGCFGVTIKHLSNESLHIIRSALQSTRTPPVDTISIKRQVLKGWHRDFSDIIVDNWDTQPKHLKIMRWIAAQEALASLDAVLEVKS